MDRPVLCGFCKETVFLRQYVSCQDCREAFHLECIPLRADQRQLITRMDGNVHYTCTLCETANRSGLEFTATRLAIIYDTINYLLQQFVAIKQQNTLLHQDVVNAISLDNRTSATPMLHTLCNRLYGINPHTLPLTMAPNSVAKVALFLTRLSPQTTSQQVEQFLASQFNITTAQVTRVKTRRQTYASFHILFNDYQLGLVLQPELWPLGIMLFPFQGNLRQELIYQEPQEQQHGNKKVTK